MTNCDRAILLGENKLWPRFCRKEIGHRGQHETVYLGRVIPFDTPVRTGGPTWRDAHTPQSGSDRLQWLPEGIPGGEVA